MRRMLYLIGRPAAGKSTLMARLTRDLAYVEHSKPVAHLDSPAGHGGWLQLGRYRPDFPGTDTLGMSAIRPVTSWLCSADFPRRDVLAEGDRLATPRFWEPLREAGWEVTVAAVHVPEEAIEARRRARDWHPNAAWLKGRDTKAERLIGEYASLVVFGNDVEKAAFELREWCPWLPA